MSPHPTSGQTREDVSQLGRDIASLGDEATKSMRNMSQTVASQVADAASGAADKGADLAAAAKDQVKTFASELEAMARRNPLGTIAGVFMAGIVIGMMARR